jgi:hypothetical protein
VKWKDQAHQQGSNFIGSEIKRVIKGQLPMININTQGGSKTDVDTDNMPKIQKEMPKEDRYHPLK